MTKANINYLKAALNRGDLAWYCRCNNWIRIYEIQSDDFDKNLTGWFYNGLSDTYISLEHLSKEDIIITSNNIADWPE